MISSPTNRSLNTDWCLDTLNDPIFSSWQLETTMSLDGIYTKEFLEENLGKELTVRADRDGGYYLCTGVLVYYTKPYKRNGKLKTTLFIKNSNNKKQNIQFRSTKGKQNE